MIESLDVSTGDKKGRQRLSPTGKDTAAKACFYFDSDYVRDGYDIAPLRAPIKGLPHSAAYRSIPMKSGFSAACRRL